MTKTTKDQARRTPQQESIRACLDRIRRRLFVVRAMERVVVALAVAGVIGAAFVLARYLRARYPAWSMVAAASPLVLVAGYWAARARWAWVRRGESPVCVRLLSILTVLTVAAGVAGLAGGFWMKLPPWSFAAGPVAVFVIVAIAAGRKVSPQAAAIFVDRQVGLEERVSTAYELLDHGAMSVEEARFQAPLVESAVEACRRVRSAKVGYARLDRRVYLAAAVCAAAAFGVTFLQPLAAMPTRGSQRQADPKVAGTAKDLQKALDELSKQHARDVTKDPALKPLEKAIQEIQAADGSKLDALAAINRARSEYNNTLDRYAGASKADKELSKDKDLAKLSEAMRKYQRALEREARGEAGAEAERAAAEKEVAEASNAIAGRLASGQMSDKERQEMADALGKAADAAKDSQLKDSLNQAGQAASAGDADKLEKSLKEAASQMGSAMADQSRNQKAMQTAKAALDGAAKQTGQSGAGGDSGSDGAGGDGSGDQTASGSDSGNGPGEGQPGEGQAGQPGEGQPGEGQAGTPGNGGTMASGGPGAESTEGPGSPGHTNERAPGGPGSNDDPAGVGATGVMRKRYASTEIENAGNKEKAGGLLDKSATAKATTEFVGPADKGDNSIVGYDKAAMEAAEKRAAENIQSGRVPPSYRDLVKKFYTTSKAGQKP